MSIGAGLVGLLATHFCRLAGAWPIIVVDPAERRLETAPTMNATHALPLTVDAARPEVERITKGRKADIVFEVTGNPIVIPGAVKLVRRRGRVVVLGSPRGPVTIDFHDEIHNFGRGVRLAQSAVQTQSRERKGVNAQKAITRPTKDHYSVAKNE